eukprot:TRINITY_DN92160_c0_g1_i1.p1 TRINITY_DN92160_c0_g1~~TRINITY_DN92160_c0_g1_i1.p1  ORF type:complete len:408 (+),score=75.55 TRINITY_DN92160_c0_g1_i1:67-1290(+)
MADAQAGAGKIFWIDAAAKKIQCANIDGSCVEDVLVGLASPSGLAVDCTRGLLYWSDLGDKKIRCAHLDGTCQEDIVSGLTTPSGTSLALDATRIYWTDLTLRQVLCAKRDGSSMTPEVFISDLFSPNAVAFDSFGNKVYWGDFASKKIHRCSADGSKAEVVVAYGKNSTSMVVDAVRGKLFWSNFGTHAIYRCSLDGKDMEPLITGLDNPSCVALAAKAGRIYWIERGNGKIRRAAVDGSHVEDVVCGLSDPWAIALGPERRRPVAPALEPSGNEGYRVEGSAEAAGDKKEGAAAEAVCTVPIQKFSWADEGSNVKVYINESSNPAVLAAAGDGRLGRVDCDFQPRSFSLNVHGEDGSLFELKVRGLLHEVLPEKCKVRVSAGKRITVSLAKKEESAWNALSSRNW